MFTLYLQEKVQHHTDEWNINKWDWEGSLKVVSKGEECTIRLEDSNSGELYAQAPVRRDQPLPVEAVIDSSRFFVLRVEDTSGPHERHAFIGIGFRERPPAYDFQAALHDHMKYVMKKKQAEELVQEYESKPSVDYSLKEGETLHLNLKSSKSKPDDKATRSKLFDQDQDPSRKDESSSVTMSSSVPFLAPPPNPAVPISLIRAASSKLNEPETESLSSRDSLKAHEDQDDDFGDFQTAG
ncbi:hypothetical protein KP509_09G005900 [Ceratopteris richardii]|uniref:NECAP PHear domain-containing protein n=1 Tax=Ceratopteris richardii TaxID=49495 RepID=A0A8T2U4H6_CERRI|nr:hypothetical protein KP509_09G005900 [Ceratopteris richardii]